MTDSLPKSSGNEKRSCKKISKLIYNIIIAAFPLSINYQIVPVRDYTYFRNKVDAPNGF